MSSAPARKSSPFFAAAPGAASFASTRNRICCTKKCCAFPRALPPRLHDTTIRKPPMSCSRRVICSCAPSATTLTGTAFSAESMPRISAPTPGAISLARNPSPTAKLPPRSSRRHADYEPLELREDAGFAGGAFTIKNSDPHDVELFRTDSLALHGRSEASAPKLLLIKEYSFGPAPNGCEVACEVVLKLKEPLDQPVAVGIESVINLLAPSEPDRFFETPTGHANLRFSGTLPAPVLRMEDGWQRVRIALHAPLAKEFWVAPIETVSESEEGFERVYQGSQILAVWRPGLTTQKSWSLRLVWRIELL